MNADYDGETRDERFLRNLIVRLKQKGGGKVSFPWRDKAVSCQRYHEHDRWAPCDDSRLVSDKIQCPALT